MTKTVTAPGNAKVTAAALTGGRTGLLTGRRHGRLCEQFDLDETLKSLERLYIEAAMRLTRGNVSRAANLLGINRTTLYSRMGKTGPRTGSKPAGFSHASATHMTSGRLLLHEVAGQE